MADTTKPGDKKLGVSGKTLALKPRVETGTVRQSFPHGRTKQVVVEKRGKRRVGGDAPDRDSRVRPSPSAARLHPSPPRRRSAAPRQARRRPRPRAAVPAWCCGR